jgi:hypothetical protein
MGTLHTLQGSTVLVMYPVSQCAMLIHITVRGTHKPLTDICHHYDVSSILNYYIV